MDHCQWEINYLKNIIELMEHYTWDAIKLQNNLTEINQKLRGLECLRTGANGAPSS